MQGPRDHRVQEHRIELIIVPFAKSMPEEKQSANRGVLGQYHVAHTFDWARRLLEEIDVRVLAFRYRSVERSQRTLKNRLDRGV